ncbi:uncharacterized protein BHQ10_004514 [Talaromyces amestolkiae]|uniref:Uncharacterized protein n=1 Tax=Talaromyces amestolkiae TaxID=1196081 RepID=A0A364KY73_TALAM|nr:uncharacterized protein BHQ10_004514 [Talaromyces amestolkiae]RAO68502.1 hypothetical protein BHQ10_004514 [Talaromyces amestolkiae]
MSLFTEDQSASKFLNLEEDSLLPPEEVARAMLALITRTEMYNSVTILEVCDVGGEDGWREAELLNDPGPRGPASKTSNKGKAVEDTMQILGIENSTLSNILGVNNE